MLGSLVNTAFNDIIKGMLTEAITIGPRESLSSNLSVQTHLARIDAARCA